MTRKKIWYRLRINDRKITPINKNGKKSVDKFDKPATEVMFKLYVVKYETKIVYVGITKQSMSNRLRQGLQAKGEQGYHGYQWMDKNEVDIRIYCYPDKDKNWVETVEAELVYQIRNETGEWPECQTEIHFHNATEEQKEEAAEIYRELN